MEEMPTTEIGATFGGYSCKRWHEMDVSASDTGGYELTRFGGVFFLPNPGKIFSLCGYGHARDFLTGWDA
jgi:hypothetical protein